MSLFNVLNFQYPSSLACVDIQVIHEIVISKKMIEGKDLQENGKPS